MGRTLRIVALGLLVSAALAGQQIKIRQLNLTRFPEITAIVSIESGTGAPMPVAVDRMKLYENGRQISEMKVSPAGDFSYPIWSVIVIDKSGSMRGAPLREAKAGAARFVSMMRSIDQAALVEFDTQVSVSRRFDAKKTGLVKQIDAIRVGSDTALLDAIWTATNLFSASTPEKVKMVLALSDGRENRSGHRLDAVIENARRQGVSIYVIGLGNRVDRAMLTRMAERTDANYYPAPRAEELQSIYQRISQLLHAQITLRFRTPFPRDDQWHLLRVEIPFQDSLLTGERLYLSARESKIPTSVLEKIVAQEEQAGKQARRRLLFQDETKTVIVLLLVLGLLVALMVGVIFSRRKRR